MLEAGSVVLEEISLVADIKNFTIWFIKLVSLHTLEPCDCLQRCIFFIYFFHVWSQMTFCKIDRQDVEMDVLKEMFIICWGFLKKNYWKSMY